MTCEPVTIPARPDEPVVDFPLSSRPEFSGKLGPDTAVLMPRYAAVRQIYRLVMGSMMTVLGMIFPFAFIRSILSGKFQFVSFGETLLPLLFLGPIFLGALYGGIRNLREFFQCFNARRAGTARGLVLFPDGLLVNEPLKSHWIPRKNIAGIVPYGEKKGKGSVRPSWAVDYHLDGRIVSHGLDCDVEPVKRWLDGTL